MPRLLAAVSASVPLVSQASLRRRIARPRLPPAAALAAQYDGAKKPGILAAAMRRNTKPAQCVTELQQPPALLLQAVAQGIAPGMLTPEMARMAACQMSSLSPDQVEQMAANLPPEQMRQFAAMTQSGPGMAGSAGAGTQVG